MKLTVARESLPLNAPFRISGHVFETSEVVTLLLEDGTARGRGEASGVYYLGDDVGHMLGALDAARGAIEGGVGRAALRYLMPAGGERNAVDAALWELEADRAGVPVWRLAGIDAPRAVVTAFTLGADYPDVMADAARDRVDARAIKVKLTGDDVLDADRVRAIRAARPDVWLGVDANQGYTIDRLDALVGVLVQARVELLEQRLQRGREADLDGYRSPIPLAGDESILTIDDVEGAKGRFDVINIKLDKCGGLTEALAMAERAERLGLGVMVGNMVGTSLALAPAFLLAQRRSIVDLDGPTFLTTDRTPSIVLSRRERMVRRHRLGTKTPGGTGMIRLLALLAAPLPIGAAAPAADPVYDIVIRGGRVRDGPVFDSNRKRGATDQASIGSIVAQSQSDYRIRPRTIGTTLHTSF